MIKRTFALLLALIAGIGCDKDALIPKEEVEFSKQYIELHQKRKYDVIENSLAPNIKDNNIRTKIAEIASLLPNEIPKSINVVGSHTVNFEDTHRYNLTFQYEFSKVWLLININLLKRAGNLVVEGFNIQPIPDSLEYINKFTFHKKGIAHYAVLALAIIVPIFIVFCLVLCIKTPIPKRRYLWILFILFGFFRISLDWTTGNININPLTFNLLGAGFFKASNYAPVIIFVSLPIGAILFLLKRNRWLTPIGQKEG